MEVETRVRMEREEEIRGIPELRKCDFPSFEKKIISYLRN